MTEYLNVGKIVNTQGIKGEVRVISRTDFPEERYKKGNTLYLFQNNELVKPLTIASYRVHKNFVLLSFEGHPSINDVEIYRDGILKVAKEDTQELDDHEFYYHEIIGCDVYDETRGLLGKVKEILSPGANDVWVIQVPKGKDILIPYIESVVLNVDVTIQRIDVSLPEGLVDDED